MTGAVRRVWDRLRGGGEHSVTVPPMDGALNPNSRLDEAEIVAEADTPDNLACAATRSCSPAAPPFCRWTAAAQRPRLWRPSTAR